MAQQQQEWGAQGQQWEAEPDADAEWEAQYASYSDMFGI